MEKVTSPDQLNDYIRVAKPSVWILLAAVIILLSGIVCWSIFGHITTSVRGACSVGSDSAAYLYVSPDDASKLKTGMGAFSSLVAMASSIAQIRPMMDMLRPIIKTQPEIAANKEVVTNLPSGISIDHISFRYSETSPYIFDQLSLQIRSGEYLAIVGKTGCGKSTLVRMLLGFETPQKGAIYYGGKDLSSLDLKSLRRHIGSVMTVIFG